MKRYLLWIIIILVLGCILAFFHTPKKESKTVIKFSSWGSKSETTLLLPLIKDFEQKNPDIKVEFIHIPQNYFQKLHLLFASNLAPDVVFINNYYAVKYINSNLLEDLTPYINKQEYFQKSLDGFTSKGKVYAIPRDVSNLVIYYNKDSFKRYGIACPDKNWTIDDYIKTGQKIFEKSEGKVWGTSFETDTIFWLPYLFSFGASILDEKGNIKISDENALDAIDLYSSLANEYKIAPKKSDSASLTMAQLFLQQRIAMHLSGRWLVPKYRNEADFDWDIAPFPKGSAGSVVNIDSSGYALSKSSKHKKEALKFIEYISSKESLNKLSQSGLIVPARKDSAYSDFFLNPKQKPLNAKVFLDCIETGRATPVNEHYQRITDKLNTVLEPVFLGQKKARDVITRELLIDLSRYAY